MDFEIEHRFNSDPGTVAAVLLDREYQDSLDGIGPLAERKVLSQEGSGGGRVHRRVRSVLGIDISGPARTLIGESDPAWIEDAVWYPDRMQWQWAIEPEIHADLLSARGTIELRPDGGGTVRRISGTVRVGVPFYGGRVEGWIVDGMRRSYEDEARLLVERLKRFDTAERRQERE